MKLPVLNHERCPGSAFSVDRLSVWFSYLVANVQSEDDG